MGESGVTWQPTYQFRWFIEERFNDTIGRWHELPARLQQKYERYCPPTKRGDVGAFEEEWRDVETVKG